MAENGLTLFGFEIKRKSSRDDEKLRSIVPATDEDGAGYVTAAGAHYGQFVDFDNNNIKDNLQQIRKYRGIAQHPEVDMAIEEIINESISTSEDKSSVEINLDNVEGPSDAIKKQMTEEFENIVSMLNFNEYGHDMFKRWYIDGRMVHHLVLDEGNPKAGIQDIRAMDAAKTRKVKHVKSKKDPVTGAKIIEGVDEFFIYEDKPGQQANGLKLTVDSISYVTSGLLDEARKKVVSHLHKAMKPINQLRMMEDSLVIYRLARAPERRIFYIDVGNLPRGKAESYMKDIMTKYRNKLVYDADTGAVKDDRKHMSMLEDFWLPRREGGRGTEITTLPGGENLGQIDDIIYFQKRMYRSLNVPVSRLEQEQQFSLGRSTEISRDEVKFQKFIDRLRRRFSGLFLDILEKQLILKQIITQEDWDNWKNNINVNYIRDNHFTELRDAELQRERLQTMELMHQYVGEFYSKEWVWKHILHLSEDEIVTMKEEMATEMDSGEVGSDDDHINPEPPEEEKPEEEEKPPKRDDVTKEEVELELVRSLVENLK